MQDNERSERDPPLRGSQVREPVRDPLGRPSWLDRVFAFRDGFLANERFQKWAIGFPLTRWIARRRARELFDIVAGFTYSQTLQACVQLDLFNLLAKSPRTPGDLAPLIDMPVASTERLLKAAASLKLMERRSGGRFGLGPLGAALLGASGVSEMVAHHAIVYADLADPVALLRQGGGGPRLARYWPYAGQPEALAERDVEAFTALMSASQRLVASEILDAYSFSGHRRLLDVGGGDGTFLTAVAARYAALELTLCDLPPVAALAREKLAARELGERVGVAACDFRSQALPEGADVVTLVRVLHDHDDDVAQDLLRAVWRALPDDGNIVVAEPMSGARGAEPVGDAYFGLYLLAMGTGRARSEAEIAVMLEKAGFAQIRRCPTRNPLATSVVSATKPRGFDRSVYPD
jgi:demethylspheroidene O-methyltransferase